MMSDSRALVLAAFLLAPLSAGCAGSEPGTAASEEALTSNPAFDAVIKDGTKIESVDQPTATESARMHLVGWIPGRTQKSVLDQLFDLPRWTEIRATDGRQPFQKVDLLGAPPSKDGEERTVAAKVSLENDVVLDFAGTSTMAGETASVRVVNTSTYKVLFVTVVEPGSVEMTIGLVPYEDGVIVDATMHVKLKHKEDRAPRLVASIKHIFDWLKSAPPR